MLFYCHIVLRQLEKKMKCLAQGFLLAVLAVAFIFFSVSISFAQTPEEWQAYQDELEQYYKNKTPKELWNDFMELRSKEELPPGGLADSAEKFREPFSSWAFEEISKVELSSVELSFFLMGNYSDEQKKYIYEKHIDRLVPPDEAQVFSPLTQEDYIILTITSLGYWINDPSRADDRRRKFAVMYRAQLIERILNTSLTDISNNNLFELLNNVSSPAHKAVIAQTILNNNPSSYDLDRLGGAGVEFYSDLAKEMLRSGDNQGYYWYIKLEFLKKKME